MNPSLLALCDHAFVSSGQPYNTTMHALRTLSQTDHEALRNRVETAQKSADWATSLTARMLLFHWSQPHTVARVDAWCSATVEEPSPLGGFPLHVRARRALASGELAWVRALEQLTRAQLWNDTSLAGTWFLIVSAVPLPEAITPLRSLLPAHVPAPIRRGALSSLAALQARDAWNEIESIARNTLDENSVRVAALSALCKLDPVRSESLCWTLFEEHDTSLTEQRSAIADCVLGIATSSMAPTIEHRLAHEHDQESALCWVLALRDVGTNRQTHTLLNASERFPELSDVIGDTVALLGETPRSHDVDVAEGL